MRDSLSVTPTHSLGASNANFSIDTIKLATYFDLDHFLPTSPGRSVLAARVLVGLALGAGACSPPPVNAASRPTSDFTEAAVPAFAATPIKPSVRISNIPIIRWRICLVAGGIEFVSGSGRTSARHSSSMRAR